MKAELIAAISLAAVLLTVLIVVAIFGCYSFHLYLTERSRHEHMTQHSDEVYDDGQAEEREALYSGYMAQDHYDNKGIRRRLITDAESKLISAEVAKICGREPSTNLTQDERHRNVLSAAESLKKVGLNLVN
jgi:hypothetical protein